MDRLQKTLLMRSFILMFRKSFCTGCHDHSSSSVYISQSFAFTSILTLNKNMAWRHSFIAEVFLIFCSMNGKCVLCQKKKWWRLQWLVHSDCCQHCLWISTLRNRCVNKTHSNQKISLAVSEALFTPGITMSSGWPDHNCAKYRCEQGPVYLREVLWSDDLGCIWTHNIHNMTATKYQLIKCVIALGRKM